MPEQTFVLSKLIKTNTSKLLTEIDFFAKVNYAHVGIEHRWCSVL